MANTMNVFTYGSLMFPAVWQKVVCGDYRSSNATIRGFRRLGVRDANHPALVISPGAAPIVGRVYYDVSAQDIARLDYFENRNYERVSVAVTIARIAIAAEAYLAVNMDALTESEWNQKSFEKAGLPVFLATYAVKNQPRD